MHTLSLRKEVKRRNSKHILLTLNNSPDQSRTTAVIKPININEEVGNVAKKLIKINSKNGRDLFLNEIYDLDKLDNNKQSLLKTIQVSEAYKKLLPDTIQRNLLDSKSRFCKTFPKLSYKRQRNDSKSLGTNLENLGSTNLESNINKNDRFVPNILRNSRTTENYNAMVLDPRDDNAMQHETEKHCKEKRNVKQKRKQLLGILDIKHDSTSRSSRVSKKQLRKPRSKNVSKKSLLRAADYKSAKENGAETFGISKRKLNRNGIRTYSKKNIKSLKIAEEETMNCSDVDDLHSADVQKADTNCITDKSVEKILAEFEVADYQNYIHSKDYHFYIDEIDKLLSSDMDGSLTDLSSYNNGINNIEYDMNGNDIDNHGNIFTKPIMKNEVEQNDIPCKIEPCYYNRIEPRMKKLKRNINPDGICLDATCTKFGAFESKSCLKVESDIYYSSSADFQQLLSTELKTNDPSSTKYLDFDLSNTENIGCPAASLKITDALPNIIFNNDSNEDSSNILESLDVSPSTPQCSLNIDESNDDNYCTSLSDIPQEIFTSNLNLYDEFKETYGFFEDGNFLVDDMSNINGAISKEDETCESIFANSITDFDEKHLLNMNGDTSEFDMEIIDKIEIPSLLISENTRSNSSVRDAMLHPYETYTTGDTCNTDTIEQLNTNHIDISNNNNSLLSSIRFENPVQEQVGSALDKLTWLHSDFSIDAVQQLNTEDISVLNNDSLFDNPVPDQAEDVLNELPYSTSIEEPKFSIENEFETAEEKCNPDNEDLEHSFTLVSASANSNEPSSPCDDVADDLYSSESSSQYSAASFIESKNIIELNTSEAESLLSELSGPEYINSNCFLEKPCNATTHLEIDNNKHCSNVICSSELDLFHTTIQSQESLQSQIIDFENIEDTIYIYTIQRENITDREMTNSNSNDNYSVAEEKYDVLLKSDNEDSYNCQSNPYSVYSPTSASQGKPPVVSEKQKKGVFQELVKRSKSITSNTSYISCDFCDEKFRSTIALADHIKVFHRYKPSLYRYKESRYICDKCSKEYSMPAAMAKHITLHENYILSCKICEKHFSEKVYLRRHIFGAHLHWNIECNNCSQKFPRKNTLSRHLKKCHGVPNYSPKSSV